MKPLMYILHALPRRRQLNGAKIQYFIQGSENDVPLNSPPTLQQQSCQHNYKLLPKLNSRFSYCSITPDSPIYPPLLPTPIVQGRPSRNQPHPAKSCRRQRQAKATNEHKTTKTYTHTMGRDGGFHPFKGRVSKHFGDSVRLPFSFFY